MTKLGRNPFTAKPTPRPARPVLDELNETSTVTQNDRLRTKGWLEHAVTLPVRSLVFGLKSLLVVRYLMAHPQEWNLS